MSILNILTRSLCSLTLVALPVLAQELTGTYDCKPTALGGLRYSPSTDSWVGVPFNLDGGGFYVGLKDYYSTQQKNYKNEFEKYHAYDIRITEYGNTSDHECYFEHQRNFEFLFAESGSPIASCSYILFDYVINFETSRYTKIFEGNYIYNPEEPNTPYIEIGTCTKLPF